MDVNHNSAAGLRAFLEENGLGMRKRFGQNFLINPDARLALVRALGAETGDSVWEIGPGLGAMTGLLLQSGLKVTAFEIDPGFVRLLGKIFEGDENLSLVPGDAMKTWRGAAPAPFLLGNLPYNIAASLLADFAENGRFFRRMVVTVQREVALRMAAGAGSRDYSSFSVLCAAFYRVRPLMVLKGASFWPRPNVDSQGVLLELREDANSANRPACFFPLVRHLFRARRKTAKNNLAGFLAQTGKSPAADSGDLAASLLAGASLDPGVRAENLSPSDFAALADAVQAL